VNSINISILAEIYLAAIEVSMNNRHPSGWYGVIIGHCM
jgi:hypothetical protein